MRRTTALALVLSALALLAGAEASAAPREASYSLSLPAGQVCAFPIRLDVTDRTRTRQVDEATTRTTGALKVTITNLDTLASIDVNASGPTTTTVRGAETFVAGQGLQLSLLAPGDVGGPGMVLVRGQLRLTRTRVGEVETITAWSARGRVTDLCALLA